MRAEQEMQRKQREAVGVSSGRAYGPEAQPWIGGCPQIHFPIANHGRISDFPSGGVH
jgi:hypothetical protein